MEVAHGQQAIRDAAESPLLGICPRCRSALVQPHGWKELASGRLLLHLRCPECQLWRVGDFEHRHVAEYDDNLVRGRQQIESQYTALVRHNMEELAERLARALELDLIGPDDFAPSALGKGLQSAPVASRRRR
jgi:hypothetical protein